MQCQNIIDTVYTFEQAVIRYSQDKNTVMNAGKMTNQQTGSSKFEYKDLPPEVAKQIYTKNDIHKANLVDDFQVIRQMLEQKLSQEYIHDWILQKQKDTYIQIDPAWRGCDFEYPNWIHD